MAGDLPCVVRVSICSFPSRLSFKNDPALLNRAWVLLLQCKTRTLEDLPSCPEVLGSSNERFEKTTRPGSGSAISTAGTVILTGYRNAADVHFRVGSFTKGDSHEKSDKHRSPGRWGNGCMGRQHAQRATAGAGIQAHAAAEAGIDRPRARGCAGHCRVCAWRCGG